MCWLVLFVAAIIALRRIPKVRSTPPSAFPNPDPETFAQWRAKSLSSIYVFLAALILPATGLETTAQSEAGNLSHGRISLRGSLLTMGLIVLIVAGLMWAAVLAFQAMRLASRMRRPSAVPRHYPRPDSSGDWPSQPALEEAPADGSPSGSPPMD